MLELSRAAYQAMLAHAYDCLPEEACGLLAGEYDGPGAPAFFPCRNEAASAKLYRVDDQDYLRADRVATGAGFDINGVMHSHTHTDAYPSPTDVRDALEPAWHYVIVSLKYDVPVLRSYRIVDGTIAEEPVVLTDAPAGSSMSPGGR
jgi:[CysO sulfur-carrier protein]-S-L-cysteine hydrolase